VSTGYSANIYTIVLREQKVYLNVLAKLDYPSRPVVFAAGFYGDYAVARYKEMRMDPMCPSGCETGHTADVYLARPTVLPNGTIEKFEDIDDAPDNEYGLSRFFVTAAANWAYKTASHDYSLFYHCCE
jgi:hypothetical protein